MEQLGAQLRKPVLVEVVPFVDGEKALDQHVGTTAGTTSTTEDSAAVAVAAARRRQHAHQNILTIGGAERRWPYELLQIRSSGATEVQSADGVAKARPGTINVR